ncbi:uncharacterized protein LOC142326846 [Lycorma delicatula]|uniref:uncharacterized protein LOC142326846 n=1 Tax=Lycorma delicatula TaxID=130591 RepID=UPI003F51AA5C
MGRSSLLCFFILLLASSIQPSQQYMYNNHLNGMYPNNMGGGTGMLNNGQYPQYPYTGMAGNPYYQQPQAPHMAGNSYYQQPQVPQTPQTPGQWNQMQNTRLPGTFVPIPGGYSIVQDRKPVYPPQCYSIQNIQTQYYPISYWEPVQKMVDGKVVTTETMYKTFCCADKYNTQFYLLQTIKYGKITGEDKVTESKVKDKYYNKLGQEGLWLPW